MAERQDDDLANIAIQFAIAFDVFDFKNDGIHEQLSMIYERRGLGPSPWVEVSGRVLIKPQQRAIPPPNG